ncbi:ead/Ea22-like family protein [Klebsiella pneumoniae]|uniref:ead/Ea22-like family protein n=1 Tax=Klebsiella pneumoniae TaxID=573 RepID=UPI003EE18F4B
MTTDITELAQRMKAAAEKATPGRWEYYPGNTSIEYNVDSMDEDQGSIVYVDSGDFTQAQTDRNGEFIALANPANILALVEALEKAQQVDEQLCKLLPPGVEYMDPPDGGDVEPIEQVRRMVADYRQRIAGLESHTVKLPDDAEHDIMAPVAAYLSEKFKWDGSAARWDGRKEYDVLADRVKYALRMVIRRAAGIKWEAE